MFDQEIITTLKTTTAINAEDKAFLTEIVSRLSALEKFKLRTALNSDQTNSLLSFIQLIKLKFPQQPKPKPTGLLGKIVQVINPPKTQKIVAPSILSQVSLIGGPAPTPIQNLNPVIFDKTDSFTNLSQLQILSPNNLINGTEDQEDLALQKFLNKLDQFFDSIPDTQLKRNYFATYLQSPIFSSYLNTGMTALKHPEIQPRETILNTLHNANPNYLDKKKFEVASIITNHLRHLCGI
jgi:hypothetical protein